MDKRRYNRVAVVMGGPSEEREVSLRSGAAIAEALRESGYAEVFEVDARDEAFVLPAGCEAVFVAIHGALGEDGLLQAELERRGMPYTGTRAADMPISFDKLSTKRALEAVGLPTPRWEVLKPGDSRCLPLPVVVKPPLQGSSVGIHLVFEEADWEPALADAFQFGDELLVEAYIPGRELTAGVLTGQALPLVEIRAPEGNYDYHAKYTGGVSEYLVPAPLDAEITARCQALALRVFEVLRGKDLGRVDFRMTSAGELYILELNAIPGFTATSLLPKAARCAGLDFPALCDRIMQVAECP